MTPHAIALALASSAPWVATASPPSTGPLPLIGLRQEPEPEPPVEEAAAAFADGEAAYARGEYGVAVEAFSEAQRLAPHPDTEFNLALALARDGRELEAWRVFERLEAEAPEVASDASEQLASLRTHLSSIQVVSGPEDPVCVDGRRQSPQTQWLMRPGPHRVEVTGFDQEFDLQPGESRVVDLRFVDREQPPPRFEPPRAVAPLLGVTAVSAAAATGAAVVAAVENREGVARGWTYGAAGASAVALGTAVAALTLHIRAKRTYRETARPKPPPAPPSCPMPDGDDVIIKTVP